jgi:hypothetical protein
MNNLDVCGILQTYALKARNAKNKEQLKEIVRELKNELDLRKLYMPKED